VLENAAWEGRDFLPVLTVSIEGEVMFGCLSTIATLALGVAAGLGKFSFWWTLIPAFVAASFLLAQGPAHNMIIRANEEGRLGVFPSLLAINTAAQLALAGVAFWIARAFG
jgi:hypothetical protein